MLKKLSLSRRVVGNAGVLAAAAVLKQGCGQCSITDTARVLLFQLQWDFTLSGIISSKGEPHIGAGGILKVKYRTSHKKERRHTPWQEGMQNNSLWEYEDPQDALKEQNLPIFHLCGHHYPTDKNLHWISGWMTPVKHLPLVQKGILNYSTCALQFWDGLGRAGKFIAFSRDILCEYSVLEFHKGCFREVEAPSIL